MAALILLIPRAALTLRVSLLRLHALSRTGLSSLPCVAALTLSKTLLRMLPLPCLLSSLPGGLWLSTLALRVFLLCALLSADALILTVSVSAHTQVRELVLHSRGEFIYDPGVLLLTRLSLFLASGKTITARRLLITPHRGLVYTLIVGVLIVGVMILELQRGAVLLIDRKLLLCLLLLQLGWG